MEQILSILLAILHWRVALGAIGSLAVAAVVSRVVPEFSAGYSLAIVILGVVFGGYWQSRADVGLTLTQNISAPRVCSPVAFLGFAVVGLLWGGLISEAFGSKVLAATSLLLGVAIVALWYGLLKGKPLQPRSLAFAAGSLLIGYSPILFLSMDRVL